MSRWVVEEYWAINDSWAPAGEDGGIDFEREIDAELYKAHMQSTYKHNGFRVREIKDVKPRTSTV